MAGENNEHHEEVAARVGRLRSNIRRAVEGFSIAEVARQSGLMEAEIRAAISADDEIDLFVVASLERWSGVSLWPPRDAAGRLGGGA